MIRKSIFAVATVAAISAAALIPTGLRRWWRQGWWWNGWWWWREWWLSRPRPPPRLLGPGLWQRCGDRTKLLAGGSRASAIVAQFFSQSDVAPVCRRETGARWRRAMLRLAAGGDQVKFGLVAHDREETSPALPRWAKCS
jgi:hypothetical protein